MRFETTKQFGCNVFSPCDEIENGNAGGGGGGNNPNCSDPDYRATHPECGDDPRCTDPAFAEANPTLCLNTPRLIVKPSSAVVEVLGEAQYAAFLVVGGVETELTEGVVWSSGDTSIALIGARSGNAIGVAVGITSVFATYGALTASAQIEVIADGACADRVNHILMLGDVSKSMTGVFGGAYANRLAVAKAVMRHLVDTANLPRDEYAVAKFDITASEVQAFTQDEAELEAAITSLATTQEHTNIAEALEFAQEYFEDVPEEDGRAVVLFSDGEHNTGPDPLPIAEALRDAGIILIIVGIRARGNPYRMLERMASGGFFVNALPSNAASVPGWVSGMRQYLCSGNCQPEGDVTLGVGELNFDNFINWDVNSGHVDLIGRNEGGPGLYDFLPGNGLYVDLCGSTLGDSPDLGVMITKESFPVVADNFYKVILRLAGNQREDRSPDVVRVQLLDQDLNEIAAESFSITDYTQDFTDYEMDVQMTLGVTSVFIVVYQESIPVGFTGVFGTLMDRVTLRDVTEDVTLFDDDFDGDNPQDIPPCGYDYGYDYGCYNTCADGPIPGQIPDPNPLPFIESEQEPQTFTSTQEATACCEDDLENCETRVATAESDISQADADQKAFAAAFELAEAALDCGDHTIAVGQLINFQFTSESVPVKTGFAVLGASSDDFWNTFFDLEDQDNLRNSAGVQTGAIMDWSSGATPQPQTHSDPVMQTAWSARQGGAPAQQIIAIMDLPAGTYTLVLYAHGPSNGDNARVRALIGTYNQETGVFTADTILGPEDTADGSGWQSSTWTEGQQFVRFNSVVVPSGKDIAFRIDPLTSAYGWYNGFQIKRTA